MKNLSEILLGTSVLSDEDSNFMMAFGSIKKPMYLTEFLPFWESLSEEERDELRHLYLGY